MPRLVLANQATAAKRRAYFHLVDATDGITAETGEASGQPQISTNGAAFTNTGIGTLTAIGTGRYYADMTQAAVLTAGDVIETRYKSAATAETPGDTFQVVAFDPDDAASLGLSRVDAAVSSRSSHGDPDPSGYIDAAVSSRNAVTPPTVAEMNARTILSASYFDPASDTVATVTTLTNKTGFSLSTAGILAIWHQLVGAIATASTMGKLLVDNINATISSRSSHGDPDPSGYIDVAISSRNATTPLTAAQVNAEVDTALDTAIPGTPTADSVNERVKALDVLLESGGSGDAAAILGDTNELQGDWTDGGRLDLILDAIKVVTDAANNLSSADVNAEVVDVLKTDTIPELAQGAPTATPSMEEALMRLYMALTNPVAVTATSKSFANDAGTVAWKKALTEDGTTYSEATGVTGP